MGRRSLKVRANSAGLLSRFASAICGRSQLLIKAGDDLPLVVATYQRSEARFANELSDSLRFTFPALSNAVTCNYREALASAPSVIVADLRSINACTCLGHHHPAVSHSRLTRTLQVDTGGKVGEIDLAVSAIRHWNPLPLAALAAACNDDRLGSFEEVRFHVALLSVFLHELEHVAFPERPEPEIRNRSNRFFVSAVSELLGVEFGLASGFTAGTMLDQPHFV